MHSITVNASNIVSANDWAQTASTTNAVGVSNWVNSVSNYVTAATNSASVTNWITTRQPASPALSNLSGTGAITNLFSLSLSNGTLKPIVFGGVGTSAGMTNTTGRLYGLEAGGNVTLTPNGSNIVIAASVSGSGISTNANQFGASVELTIKDGAFLTNLNVQTSLEVSNGYIYAVGPVTNGTQLNLPHLTVSRSAVINAQGDVTNSSADANWSLYPTNVWNDRQGGSAVLTNLAGTGAITNLFSPTLSYNHHKAISGWGRYGGRSYQHYGPHQGIGGGCQHYDYA